MDDFGQDAGAIDGGWSLLLTVPTIFTVNSTADMTDGVCDATNCTLREAITAAQNGDLINFSSLFNTPQTINLLTVLPDITRSITIQGTGANLLTVRRDFNVADFRIFNVPAGVANGVAISGMTISNGRADQGAGIRSESNLLLTNVHVTGNHSSNLGGGVLFFEGVFTHSTFSNNTAVVQGGGIYYNGVSGRTLRLVSSTVSTNSAGAGGGIFFNVNDHGNAQLEAINDTIANNTSTQNGGGIYTRTVFEGSGATVTLRNTIIAGNLQNNLATEASFGGDPPVVTTNGFNLSDNFNGVFTPIPGSDIIAPPLLAPLALHGGQAPTHTLRSGSPALDKGNSSGSGQDQRGVARIFNIASIAPPSGGDEADIGAVEMQAILVTNGNDAGAGSLRAAITSANMNGLGLDDIIIDPVGTIALDSALPDLASSMTLNGPGGGDVQIFRPSEAPPFRLFNITPGQIVSLSGLRMYGGMATTGGGIQNTDSFLTVAQCSLESSTATIGGNTYAGGAIHNFSSAGRATLILQQSSLINNSAPSGLGGGISSHGNNAVLHVSNTTFAGNTGGAGGGSDIDHDVAAGGSTAIVRNCTFSVTPGGEFGVLAFGQPLTVGNSIFHSATGVANFAGNVLSEGYNLSDGNDGTVLNGATDTVNTDPILGPLTGDGLLGFVFFPPLSNSPAIDRGRDLAGTGRDQRGIVRPTVYGDASITVPAGGDRSDIGAVELLPAPLPTSAVSRKMHGAFTGDVPLNLRGPVSTEPRASGSYQLVLNFPTIVSGNFVSVVNGTGNVDSATVSGSMITVDLSGVTNAQRLTLGIFGVTDGSLTGDIGLRLGFLVGDTAGNGTVNGTDVSQTKLQSGQAASGSNFRSDVNVSGSINGTDVSSVKSKSGTALPP